MTVRELVAYMNREFTKEGIEKPWPDSMVVDHETYANACQAVFDSLLATGIGNSIWANCIITLSVNRRLMFKGVELSLKDKE